MKNIVVNYKVFNEKIEDESILLLTDFHDFHLDEKSTLIEDIKKENASCTVISGDILHSSKYIIGSDSQKKLKYFLSGISEEIPVFLGRGNHDKFLGTSESDAGYKDLENARPGKVFPLNNESMIHDGMRIIEFNPSHDAFAPAIQESGGALLRVCDDFYKSGLEIPNDELLNVLIFHNPKVFAQGRCVSQQLGLEFTPDEFAQLLEFSKELKKIGVCLSGHLHNGYLTLDSVLKNPEKYMDKGIWEMPMEKDKNGIVTKIRPHVFKNTDMCRGTILVGENLDRIIELCNGKFYLQRPGEEPRLLTEAQVLEKQKAHCMTPIVISTGVNKYFNLPIDNSEITKVRLLKR